MRMSETKLRLLNQPRITAIDGAFGMPDMFTQKEEAMKPDTFTVEVTTYPGTTEVFTECSSATVEEGFLRIIQDRRVTAFNVQDVSRTVSYEGS